MTLRCRSCEQQWRTHVDAAWRKRRCGFFTSEQGCLQGDRCTKLHIHAKKLSREERQEAHTERCTAALAETNSDALSSDPDVCSTSSSGTGDMATASPSTLRMPCDHNSWDNVRVKRGVATLRCRMCREQWRRPRDSPANCEDFPDCADGAACDKLHVHIFKKTKEHPCVADPVQPGPVARVPDQPLAAYGRGAPVHWPVAAMRDGAQVWFDAPGTITNTAAFADATLLQGTATDAHQGMSLQLRLPSSHTTTLFVAHLGGVYSEALERSGWTNVSGAHAPCIDNAPTVLHCMCVSSAGGQLLTLPPTPVAHVQFSIFSVARPVYLPQAQPIEAAVCELYQARGRTATRAPRTVPRGVTPSPTTTDSEDDEMLGAELGSFPRCSSCPPTIAGTCEV